MMSSADAIRRRLDLYSRLNGYHETLDSADQMIATLRGVMAEVEWHRSLGAVHVHVDTLEELIAAGLDV